jgi:hypothetical protein
MVAKMSWHFTFAPLPFSLTWRANGRVNDETAKRVDISSGGCLEVERCGASVCGPVWQFRLGCFGKIRWYYTTSSFCGKKRFLLSLVS